ncbi:DUF4040 domain-containing protein [Halapricum desulfuricans]|uniref:Multisubunit Na+/H+ antiporter, MnhB subunit n=1 Tax=Halapricum desulfuricans TaxID=2841257 RepID=A0A897N263_9EURY|nr:DUF4040 domain-containing protein [Halapricum desulfuricans]QSG04416.1 Multisubunit Na+/H+ antiporter, MnhB subunit [Halapricum desulfuricans]
MTPLVAALLALVVAVAVVTALARDILVATVAFAAYSLGLAVLWVVFDAPDVALTEAAVGAGVVTALFVAVLSRTTRPVGGRSFSLAVSPTAVIAAGALTAALVATVPSLPAVGDPDAPAFDGAAAYYLQETGTYGIDNAVTAVLVVFRGFDTFGEIAVVFTAIAAVLVVRGRGDA